MQSPWLYQLNRKREVQPLAQNHTADVCIIGGGIAGVATAYALLTETDQSVALIEMDKVAHGATGHNAGQVASYFERSFASLVDEFGLEMAARGQTDVYNAWEYLESIIVAAGIQTPFYPVTGYAGLSSPRLIVDHLENTALKQLAGVPAETLYIAEEYDVSWIDADLHQYFVRIPHKNLLQLLETHDTRFIGALAGRKGCLNSAVFTEELAAYLLSAFPDRFLLAEHTPATRVRLQKDAVVIETSTEYNVTADRVVLCTNGFEHFALISEHGPEINTSFHHMIHGTVGYMAAYVDELNAPPIAMSYLDSHIAKSGAAEEPDTYYYLTRRPFDYAKDAAGSQYQKYNLTSIGGLDDRLDHVEQYSQGLEYPGKAMDAIEQFLQDTYSPAPDDPEYAFLWHGLMGYTPNAVRRIGIDPVQPRVLYNLGCNGVGILPSLFGAQRLGQICAGKAVEASMFDIPSET